VESQILVKLRADLADTGYASEMPSLATNEAFQKEYRDTVAKTAGSVQFNTAVGTGKFAVSFYLSNQVTAIALTAATSAAAELGIQGGILSTGAGSFVATAGLGLLIAYIIDQLLDAIFHALGHDPAAKIEAEVIASLDKMEDALLREPGALWHVRLGTNGSLRNELENMHRARSKVRGEVVQLILKGGAR
jgi:hypothetical protein